MSSSSSSTHPLDHPIWNALKTRQQTLAEGATLALRYPQSIAPCAAMVDTSPQSFSALGELISRSDIAVLFTPDPVTAPAEFKILLAETAEQMIGTPVESAIPGVQIVRLGADDVPAMMALIELTKPGSLQRANARIGNLSGHPDRRAARRDDRRTDEASQLHRDHRGLRASVASRPRPCASSACRNFTPDRREGRDSVSTCVLE